MRSAFLSTDFVKNLEILDGQGDKVLFHKILWDYLPDSDPVVNEIISKEVAKFAKRKKADIILGIESSSIGVASTASLFSECYFGFIRKNPKSYGLMRFVEGNFNGKKRVVIVDNYTFTGGTLTRAANAVKREGFKICGVISVDGFKNIPKTPDYLKLDVKTLVDNSKKIDYLLTTDYFPELLKPYIKIYIRKPQYFFSNSQTYLDYLNAFKIAYKSKSNVLFVNPEKNTNKSLLRRIIYFILELFQ